MMPLENTYNGIIRIKVQYNDKKAVFLCSSFLLQLELCSVIDNIHENLLSFINRLLKMNSLLFFWTIVGFVSGMSHVLINRKQNFGH